MRFVFTRLYGALLGLCAAAVLSCSRLPEELPRPAAVPESAGLSVAEARAWYQAALATAPDAPAITSANGTQPPAPAGSQVVWARAITVGQGAQQLVLVPLAGDAALFARRPYAGTRYLIVTRTSTNALDGSLVEVLLRRTPAPLDTLALFTDLYHSYRSGRFAAPGTGEGYVFLYSADYRYQAGRPFRHGQFVRGSARLGFQPVPGTGTAPATGKGTGGVAKTDNVPPIDACIDWYDANTGDFIVRTGHCDDFGGGAGDVPHVYTGGGGPGGIATGPSGYGGHGTTGGGAVATLSPNVVFALPPPPNHKIQNVPEHLKCFDRNQSATFSVYATQPKPGTRATWSGSVTDPNVGHTFISITQGGITRVIGFYPAAGITPFNPSGPSTLADDSDHDYSVRIDMPLTSTQLGNVLNYILAYPGTYNLNTYNCTGFGIGAASAAGLFLPTTQGSWGPGSGGLNPGDLGQDMRTMSLPAGASRDTQSGQADSDNGNC